jgi:hypothetical protein
MKTKKEIEQLAFLEYPRLINDHYNPMKDDNTDERKIWIEGYTQCQEDMKPLLKDLFDLWERLAEAGDLSIGLNFNKKYDELKKIIT